ncbi:MAG: hypothetical protein ACETWR_12370 [Anaerolineae bacterium]
MSGGCQILIRLSEDADGQRSHWRALGDGLNLAQGTNSFHLTVSTPIAAAASSSSFMARVHVVYGHEIARSLGQPLRL